MPQRCAGTGSSTGPTSRFASGRPSPARASSSNGSTCPIVRSVPARIDRVVPVVAPDHDQAGRCHRGNDRTRAGRLGRNARRQLHRPDRRAGVPRLRRLEPRLRRSHSKKPASSSRTGCGRCSSSRARWSFAREKPRSWPIPGAQGRSLWHIISIMARMPRSPLTVTAWGFLRRHSSERSLPAAPSSPRARQMLFAPRASACRTTAADLLIFGREGPIGNSLRFPDECARHKVLDLLGDLALVGFDLEGLVVAHRSGHQTNHALARRLFDLARSEIRSIDRRRRTRAQRRSRHSGHHEPVASPLPVPAG